MMNVIVWQYVKRTASFLSSPWERLPLHPYPVMLNHNKVIWVEVTLNTILARKVDRLFDVMHWCWDEPSLYCGLWSPRVRSKVFPHQLSQPVFTRGPKHASTSRSRVWTSKRASGKYVLQYSRVRTRFPWVSVFCSFFSKLALIILVAALLWKLWRSLSLCSRWKAHFNLVSQFT